MAQYVAFLRGINVGGHKPLRMKDVSAVFETLGLARVKTLLASGNVLFDSRKRAPRKLSEKIEDALRKTFGHEIATVIRRIDELQPLLEANPFRGIRVTPRTRLFVTFLSEASKSSLRLPYVSPGGGFRILYNTGHEICYVLTLGPQWSKNLREMSILEKEFGKRITTRSWSTVGRIIKASRAAPETIRSSAR